ncbi:MAG: energy transducer TonB [Thermodesulfobacteriota bacterium]
MAGETKKKRKTKWGIWALSFSLVAVFVILAGLIIHMLFSDDSPNRKRQIQTVTLVKPPPPKIKEKPPEPEIVKKEEIIEQEIEEVPPEDTNPAEQDDAKPIDDLLGLDADGGAGADGFGLKAKKGGRSIIGGNLSNQYGWYTSMVQKELNELVREYMDRYGGIPKGNLKAMVKIRLDPEGRIRKIKIVRSSGNKRMDEAVQLALKSADISEMPPPDMPLVLKFRISSQG